MATKPRRVTIEIHEVRPGHVLWTLLDHQRRPVISAAHWREGMASANVFNALHEAADAAHTLLWNEGTAR